MSQEVLTRWVSLTPATLALYQAGPMVEAYRTAALAQGQQDPVPESIQNTVYKIRAAISGGGYAVDRNTTKIPRELVNDALAIITATVKPRILEDLSNAETKAWDNAESLLREIAKGKYAVSLPDDPLMPAETMQSQGGAAIVRPAAGTPQREDFNVL